MSEDKGINVHLEKYGVSATLRAIALAYRNRKTLPQDKLALVPVAAALMNVSVSMAQGILDGEIDFQYMDQFNMRLEGIDELTKCLHIRIEAGGTLVSPGAREWGGFITLDSFKETIDRVSESIDLS
jgi:hypothetical protein